MYNDKLSELKNEVSSIFLNVNNKKDLEQLKQEYLSKNGKITQINSLIREVPNEEKRDFGMKVNEIKNYFNEEYSKMLEKFETEEINKKLESEAIDVTLPSKKIRRGSKHPMTRIQEELEDLFVSMGYDVYDGPEIETDENCFQKLNLPLGHPARDAQDTFYLKDEYEKTGDESIQKKYLDVREKIISHNLRMCFHFARNYCNKNNMMNYIMKLKKMVD